MANRRCPIGEPVPSAAMLERQACLRRFIEIRMGVVGVPCDEAVVDPADQSTFTDCQTRCRLLPCQQASIPEPIVAGAEAVLVGEIGNPQSSESCIGLASACRTARADSAVIQDVSDFRVNFRGVCRPVRQLCDQSLPAGLTIWGSALSGYQSFLP